jgi:hypothetical protein
MVLPGEVPMVAPLVPLLCADAAPMPNASTAAAVRRRRFIL